MSLYSRLVGGLLFPLHEKMKGHTTIAVHRQMESSQWLSPEELEKLQLRRLREFLCDIGTHVPYYRELFVRLRFDPMALSSIQDLQHLPLMDKPLIRENTEQFKAENATGLQRFNTGGSSGEPLIFYLGNKRVSHDVAAKRRATRWWGVDIGDPEIVVWGSPIELNSQDRIRAMRDKLFRTELLSAFEMSEQNLDAFLQAIRLKRPKMLFGYPSSLAHIARHAQEKGVAMDDLGVKVAFVTSERLYDHQRKQIQEVFKCPVANGYGGRDAGFIAHQCPEGSMHLTAEDLVVEIIDKNGETLPIGERGEIVVTHLCTNDFPFVRYRTGDVGVLTADTCVCGRGLPLLKSIEGRTTDFLVAADGAVVHGLALIYILRDMPTVESFRIVQEAVNKITVQLLTGADYQQEAEGVITEGFRQRLGNALEVNFEYMEDIPREKSGKFRYVVSKVPS